MLHNVGFLALHRRLADAVKKRSGYGADLRRL